MNPIPIGISRRDALGVAAGSALTVMLSACSNDSNSSKSSTSGTAASGVTAGGKFPQTVKGVYGNVTVKDQPKRVVALFVAYADICVALGVQPVAISANASELEPWYKGRFAGKLDPSLATSDYMPAPEKIASYHPDLVTSMASDKQHDEQIAKIAPLYCGRVTGTQSWVDILDDLSLLLTGFSDRAAGAKKRVADSMAPYKARIKRLQGKEFMWIASRDQIYYGNGSAFEALGLKPAVQHNDAAKQNLSYENIAQLDAPILAITAGATSRKKLESDPRFAQLPASKNGTVVWATDDEATAMQHSCPSAFKYIADWIVPALEKSELNTQG